MLRTVVTAIAVFGSVLRAPTNADETDVWSRETAVSITITNYQFTPQRVALHHGTAYRLRLLNASGRSHSCSAPDLFASSTIALVDRTKIDAGSVDIEPDSEVEVFFVPLTPGDYVLACNHFLHAAPRMYGVVAVN